MAERGIEHRRIEDIETISGVLEGVSMVRVASDLGVSAFGISIVDMEAGAEDYPEHDHSPEGMGGDMFAKRPEQLGQEEVYVALRGSGTVATEEAEYPLDADHIVRVGPEVKRKITPGSEGLRLLAIGAIPGEAYGAAAQK